MQAIKTRGTTAILGAPRGWDESEYGECKGLPIVESEGMMFSWWKPKWKERARIFFGGSIRLVVVGKSHPAVAIDAEQP